MASVIEDIKERLDLAGFLRGYLEVRPAGKNFKALCPFHKEKTPSFMISPDRQIWHCFGCGEGGDIFRFLMKYENLEFYEALKILAEKAGVELKKVSPAEQREFGVLYDINQTAAEFFRENLLRSEPACLYVVSRGISEETSNGFNLGFAPPGFEDLTVFLINKGFDVRDLSRSGMIIRNERGKYFDRFRGRLMFPLLNSFGKTVGFSGRILPQFDNGETAKYLNSPETPIFSKSRVIYGFSRAKEAIRESGFVLLVEGQMDVVMAHQDGAKNTVGTSGTALTRDHLKTLKRYSDKLVLCFDNDFAGRQATERSIDAAHEADFEVRVLNIEKSAPAGKKIKDPADFAVEAPGLLKEAALKAEPAMEYYFDVYSAAGGSITEKKNGLRGILGKIIKVSSPIEREYWLKKLSERSGVKEETLIEEMYRAPSSGETGGGRAGEEKTAEKLSRKELIAERILAIFTLKEEFREELEKRKDYLPSRYLAVYNCIVSGANPADSETAKIFDLVCLRAGLEEKDKKELIGEFGDLLRYLEIEFLSEEAAKQGALIRKEESEDREGSSEQIRQFQEIAAKINELKRKNVPKKPNL
jgi:DNA primase